MSNPQDDGTELARERATLVKADEDLAAGVARIRHHQELREGMERNGQDTGLAVKLEQTLHETLIEWQHHRVLILERIAYLEGRVAAARAPAA